jgi:hypothetical protein
MSELPTDAMIEAGRLALMDEREHDRCISLEPAEMRVAIEAALAVAPRDEAAEERAMSLGHDCGFNAATALAEWREKALVDDAFDAGLEEAARYHDGEAERIRRTCRPLTLAPVASIYAHDEAAVAIRALKRSAK